MKTSFFNFSLFVFVIAVLVSCTNSEDALAKEKRIKDSLQGIENANAQLSKISKDTGIVGVFNIPEMLTICKLDSAPMRDVAFLVAKNYSLLEEEMNAIGAKVDGMPGMITYNNDTTNFIFECVLPIKEVPVKQPKKCQVIVLEATPMLIYNFYGAYNQLFFAYDKIRKYIDANKLTQNGPMREFYLSDPTIEKDPAKWQTRIMVPVINSK
jgi:effector-binding domain-containing protein